MKKPLIILFYLSFIFLIGISASHAQIQTDEPGKTIINKSLDSKDNLKNTDYPSLGTIGRANKNDNLKNGSGNLGNIYTFTDIGLNYVSVSKATGTRVGYSGTPTTLSVAGIPAGSTIVKAFLWYGGVTNAGDPGLVFNGTPYTAIITGLSGDICWGYANSVGFRADVTASVTGNGTYSVDPNEPDVNVNGMTLFVIYKQSTATYSGTLSINDGAMAISGGSLSNTVIIPPPGDVTIAAKAFGIVADFQMDFIYNFNGVNGTGAFAWWNMTEVNTSFAIGTTSCNLGYTSFGDCYVWIVSGAYYQVELPCTNPNSGGTIADNQTGCSPFDPALLASTAVPSGHTGTLEYKWQKSTTNGSSGFSDIAGSNAVTYDPPAGLTATTWYKRLARVDCMPDWTGAQESNVLQISVDPVSVGGSVAGSTTVCSGTNTTTLTLSGHTGSIVKWQYSTNNWVSSTDVVNTTTTLIATNLTTTTKYRAVIQSGVCSSTNSGEATVTVDPVSVGGSIAGSTTVCSGTNTTTLTLSGYTGNVVKWQYSTNNWVSSTDVVNTTTTLVATNLTTTTKYRAVIQSGVCSSTNSGEATVTVDPVSVGGSIAGSTTVCSGTNTTTLTLSGHTGSIVKWQYSTNNWVSSTDVVNTTTTLVATNLTTTTKYRAVIQSGVCSSTNSGEATVTVDPVSVGGSIAGSTTVCSGTNTTTLTLSGHTGSIVKWQYSTNNWVSSTDVVNTTTTLVATNLTTTTKYRAVIQSGVCSLINSGEATVTVDPVSVGGSIAGSTTVCSGTNTTTLTLSGHTGSIVKWQYSTNNWVSSTDVVNTTTTLIATNLTTTTKYRAVIQSGVCSSTNSGEATVTVDPVSVGGSIAGSITVCSGTNTTTLTLSGHTGNVVKWQYSTNNWVSSTDVVNTTTTLIATNLTTTTKYRAVIQSGVCSSANSGEATVTVDPVSVGGSIAGSTTVCSGTNTTTLTLSGHTGSIVKWQYSTDNWVSSTDVVNTTTTLIATNLTTTTKYRAVIQSGVCSSTNSGEATVTVDPVSVGGSIAGSTTVCSGTNTTTLTLSGHTGSIVKWQYSTNNWVSSTDVVNITTTLVATNLTTTTKYRAVIQSGVCSSTNSGEATVTVDPVSVGGSIAGSTTVCSGTNTTTLTLSGHTGSIVKWQYSTNNWVSSTDVVNITTTLVATNLTTTTKYRAVIQSGVCLSANSSDATITVDQIPVPTIAGPTGLCVNSGYFNYTTEPGMNAYTWTLSSGGSTTYGSGTNQIEVVWNASGAQTVSVIYTTPSGCSPVGTTVLSVTVDPLPGNAGGITGITTVCAGAQGVPYSTSVIANTMTYVWSLPQGATIQNGAGTNSIMVDFGINAVSGDISVYGNNLCGNGSTSSSFPVIVNSVPETPVVVANGGNLLSSAPLGNQWYYSPTAGGTGTPITGATAQVYVATQTGWYWTIITLNDCSSDSSNHEYVLNTGMKEIQEPAIVVYPVPNNGSFTISVQYPGETTFSILVYDMLGSKILENNDLRTINHKYQKTIDLQPITNGIYSVVILNAEFKVVRKVIVNR